MLLVIMRWKNKEKNINHIGKDWNPKVICSLGINDCEITGLSPLTKELNIP